MKKLLTFLIAAALLASSVPAAIADGAYAELTLDPASALAIGDDGYVENMADGTTAAELLSNFADRKNVTLTAKDGTPLTLTDAVGSDAVLTYTTASGTSTAKTWMAGDINGDAKISAKDVSVLLKKQAGYNIDVCEKAADVNGDSALNGKDAAQIMKHLAGWNVTIAKPAYAGETAEHEDVGMGVYFTSIMDRIARGDTSVHGTLDYVYRMAKNEVETAEIVFTSTEAKTGLTLEIGDIANAAGDVLRRTVHYGYYYDLTIFTELAGKDYSKTSSGMYVDPLPEYSGKFDMGEKESMTFAVKIFTEADTASGMYKADVVLRDAEGNAIKKATLRVFVWDFALDAAPACETAFGIGYGNILTWMGDHDLAKMNSFPSDVLAAEYEEWYEYLVENRISPYFLPGDIESEKSLEYIHDPRVTSFCAYGGNGAPTYEETETKFGDIADLFRRHADDPVWLDKAYIYSVDEPCEKSQFDFIERQWAEFNRLMPDIPFRIVTPLGGNEFYNKEKRDRAQIVFDATTIMCPSSTAFTLYMRAPEMKASEGRFPAYQGSGFTPFSVFSQYGQFEDRWAEWKAQGKDAWWYVCIGPEFPYANFFNYYQGNIARILFWQQYYFDVEGLLYWETTFWEMSTDSHAEISRRRTSVGDGLLLYPPQLFGMDYTSAPVPSIRLESVRDGIEDFQYFAQLERELGRKAVLEYVSRNTDAILHFTEEADDISNVRCELGFLLESLAK